MQSKPLNVKAKINELKIPKEISEWMESVGLPVELLDIWYVFEMGANKHGRDSYLDKKNVSMENAANFSSICRHAAKSAWDWQIDKESGLSHDLHIATRAIMKHTRRIRRLDKT